MRAAWAREALTPRRSSPRASIDLPAGEATPLRARRARVPTTPDSTGTPGQQAAGGDLTRIVPGDVSARTPAKARRRLATVPGRLGFVFAPRHGSWPNLVEGLFSRTAHQMPRSDPGLERRRARREGSAPPQGRRAPSRSSTGGGGTCRTQARRPRDPSWTPSFRMGQTGQVSCWTLYSSRLRPRRRAPAAGTRASLTRRACTPGDGAHRGREGLSAGLVVPPSYAVVINTAPPDAHAPRSLGRSPERSRRGTRSPARPRGPSGGTRSCSCGPA